MSSWVLNLSNHTYRFLLNLYPRTFRVRFGEAMLEDFREESDEVLREEGLRGLSIYWFCTMADLATSSFAEYWSQEATRRSIRRWLPAVCTAILALGLRAVLGGPVFAYLWGWLLISPLMAALADSVFPLSPVTPPWRERLWESSAPLGLLAVFEVFFIGVLAAMLPRLAEPSALAEVFRVFVLPAAALVAGALPFCREDRSLRPRPVSSRRMVVVHRAATVFPEG